LGKEGLQENKKGNMQTDEKENDGKSAKSELENNSY